MITKEDQSLFGGFKDIAVKGILDLAKAKTSEGLEREFGRDEKRAKENLANQELALAKAAAAASQPKIVSLGESAQEDQNVNNNGGDAPGRGDVTNNQSGSPTLLIIGGLVAVVLIPLILIFSSRGGSK